MRASVLIVALAFTAGCSSSAPENVPSPDQTPARANRPVGGMPAASNSPGAQAPSPHTGEPSKSGPTDEQVAALQEAYDKNKSNDAAKQLLVGALVARADFYMGADEIAPREKYPKALALYRRAVALDPSNTTAQEGISTIEGIYKSMGRPVPEV
jgi:hypothetical protein